MRFIGAFTLTCLAVSLGPSEAVTPLPACSAAFVKRWIEHDRRAEIPTPPRPCVMQAETGRYTCNKDGCSRSP